MCIKTTIRKLDKIIQVLLRCFIQILLNTYLYIFESIQIYNLILKTILF